MVPSYLAYTGIRVSDPRRSVEFYTESFGLTEVSRGDNSAFGGGESVLLEDPLTGQKLELNWYPPGSRYATPYISGEGLDHVAFHVADLATKRSELARAGYRPVRREDPQELSPGFKIAYVGDPDGNWVELWQQPEPMPTTPPQTY